MSRASQDSDNSDSDDSTHIRLRNQLHPRKRTWMGTIWIPEDLDNLKNMRYKYLIISDEDHTQEGQLHWHVVIQFKNARVRPRMINSNSHWESPRSIVEAINYCKQKGPNFQEFGNMDLCTRNTSDWKGFVDACKRLSSRELIDSEFSQTYARYRGFAGEVKIQFTEINCLESLDNLWIYGPPGTGKTTYVYEHFSDSLYTKPINKWWDGYNFEENILLDDWDVTHRVTSGYLKIWADKWPFLAEIKGSAVKIRPKRIIITSNYSIDTLFGDDESLCNAIRRRFKVLHIIGYNDHHFE
nr:MAG: replication-associated protein [Cressdnaviricota sp.]